MDKIVIIGAGEAGAAAAVTLRQRGFAGSIILVGRESLVPYERPPLSKDVLLGEDTSPPKLVSGAARFTDLNIVVLTDALATTIDRPKHHVILADGRLLRYDRLLLTTGADPRRLSFQSPRIHTLRTYQDAVALREILRPGSNVIIIGGGFIGLECAAAAVERGADVTVIEAAPRILARAVPEAIAEIVASRHQTAGVRLLTSSIIANIHDTGEGLTVELTDGTMLSANAVIVGIGVAPTVQLAADSGLLVANGILVDTHLTTSDPSIFAAGDCASFPHPLYDGRIIRLEAWRNAIDQGVCAAHNMLGSPLPFAAVPWFWSDQYDLHLQIAGLASPGDKIAIRDLGSNARLQFHLNSDGRLIAACGIGPRELIARDIRLSEMLIAQRSHPAQAALISPSFKLKAFLDSRSDPVQASVD